MKRAKKPKIAKRKKDFFLGGNEALEQESLKQKKLGSLGFQNPGMPHEHRDIWM
jgi:hypothetical protein